MVILQTYQDAQAGIRPFKVCTAEIRTVSINIFLLETSKKSRQLLNIFHSTWRSLCSYSSSYNVLNRREEDH